MERFVIGHAFGLIVADTLCLSLQLGVLEFCLVIASRRHCGLLDPPVVFVCVTSDALFYIGLCR